MKPLLASIASFLCLAVALGALFAVVALMGGCGGGVSPGAPLSPALTARFAEMERCTGRTDSPPTVRYEPAVTCVQAPIVECLPSHPSKAGWNEDGVITLVQPGTEDPGVAWYIDGDATRHEFVDYLMGHEADCSPEMKRCAPASTEAC